jgi:hypothetical protein
MGPIPDARPVTDAQPVLFDVELPNEEWDPPLAALPPLPPVVPVGPVDDLDAERSRRRFTEGA